MPQNTLSAGQKFGPFEVIGILGSGGMGHVYKAIELSLERPVALKIIGGTEQHQTELNERFKHEAKTLAKVNHPNVVGVYFFGVEDNIQYIAMEFCEGITLKKLAKESVFFPWDLGHIILSLLEGTQAIHESGIVHRDLKSSNILLSEKGPLKILDFGIAKVTSEFNQGLTSTGQILGTMQYIAPEILQGIDYSIQSDIYTLGLIFYELLAGVNPFLGVTNYATVENIKNQELKFSEETSRYIPDSLQALLLKMTHKDPMLRFRRLSDVISSLRRILAQEAFFQAPAGFSRNILDPSLFGAREILNRIKVNSPLERSFIIAQAWKFRNSQSIFASPSPDITISIDNVDASTSLEFSEQEILSARKILQDKWKEIPKIVRHYSAPMKELPKKSPAPASERNEVTFEIEIEIPPEELRARRPTPVKKEVEKKLEVEIHSPPDADKTMADALVEGLQSKMKKIFGKK